MITRLERIVIALVLAVVAAGVTLVMASAQGQSQTEPADPAAQPDCQTCHQPFYDSWTGGPHGQSSTSPTFLEEWGKQGNPGACLVCHTTGYDTSTGVYAAENVDCAACHSPIPANHPQENMPVDKSTDTCVRCHSSVEFGVSNWAMSGHYQRNMTCTACHNPHSTDLRSITGQELEDPSDLCINCHKDYPASYEHSAHAQSGIGCVNCHLDLGSDPESFATAHQVPDHNFMPEIATCSSCHAHQMHAAGDAAGAIEQEGESVAAEPVQNGNAGEVSTTPEPVSPVGFASLAGLIGIAAGAVLGPWMRKFLSRLGGSK